MVRPVYLAWLGAAMELNSFGIPLRQFDRFADASMFRGRTWSWVDPLKESQALIQGMQAGIQSLDDAASHYGRDSEDLLAQIARDRDLAAQFGITYALQPFGVQKMPVDADGVEGDEE